MGEERGRGHAGDVMELRELLTALYKEMKEAGVPVEGSSASLAFVAKRDRDGEVQVEFVDAAAMSKPRPEELHRLELYLTDAPASVFEVVDEDEDGVPDKLEGGLFSKGGSLDSPPTFRKPGSPPALPKR